MIEHRDSHQIEASGTDEAPASPSRRFARLVESPGSRRISPRRLAQAVGATLLGLAAVGFGGAWLARSIAGWVGAQPEYQIPFAGIALIPEPPPYIRGGSAAFLDQVRDEARLGETLPLLTVDLDEIRKVFLHSPWIKGVTRVERSPGRLAVHLEYRIPIAVVEFEKGRGKVIDDEGVILPSEIRDMDWVEKGPRFLVRGIEIPLIEITDVGRPAGTLPGFRWKRADGTPDPQVLGAASLAKFLRSHDFRTPGGRAVPRFVRVKPDLETPHLHILDANQHYVFWGEAPGAESRGMPKAEAKWDKLLAWIDEHGSLDLKPGEYLVFDHLGAKVGGPPRPAPRSKKDGR